MFLKLIKKIIAITLCLALVCFIPITVQGETDGTDFQIAEPLEDYMQISESENLILYVNVSNANIAVVDKCSNKVWTAYKEGLSSMDSRTSMLNVTYSGANNILIQVGTHDASTGFDIMKIDGGIKEIFYFETDAVTFEIPFKVVLKEDFVEITLLYKEVKEKGKGKISDIELLPNWGEGSAEQDGYIFIPDGSGAIIEYKDIISRIDTYSGRVYGKDPSQDLVYPEISDSQMVRLPLFGIRQDSSAILSVITAGDALATVNAVANNNNAIVFASFIYRESDLTGIQENGGATRTMTILQSKPVSVQPVIRQYYLNGDDATYSGMANTYRSYLEDKGVLKNRSDKQTSAVTIEAFGAVSQQKSFMGIPYNHILAVTSFKDLEKLSEKLKKDNINNPSFYLYGFIGDGYEKGINVKPDYIGKLGGKKGYKAFISKAGNDNVYTVYNISRSFGNPFSLFSANQYVRSLNQTTVEQHYRLLATGTWNTDFGIWKYYTVDKQKKLFTKLLKNLPKNSNIVLEHLGEELITDFNNKKSVSRNEYLKFLNQMFEKCSKSKTGLAFESGNAYTANFAKEIYEIPLESSGFSIESYSVPVYSMVFHGYIPLSSNAVNDTSNAKLYKLKAFEQGVSATWRITGMDTYEIKDTKLNFLYNSKIDSIYDSAVSMAKDYSDIHSVLYNQCITNHRYESDLSITTYENGWQILCNYGDKPVIYNGIEVSSADYAIIR